ncbi:MAG TPA: DUF4352 domain-containing protein [Dehalococcoidia bacterium]|nr:DUF4352 domain-containing protein [Dehalococcoidia bacterium]
MLKKALLPALSAVLVLAVAACGGGGGGGGGGSEEEQVTRATNQHIKVLLGVITGGSSGKDVINTFAPECRGGVNASEIDAALGLIRLFVPQLAQAKIEEVDVGKLRLVKVAEGYEVRPENVDAIRIKSKGKWQTADEFFSGLGLGGGSDPSDELESLLLVKRDGKWYLGDCGELRDFGGGLGGSGNSPDTRVTVTAGGRTPTPTRTGPGSSRSNPVRLGQPGRIEGKWEITVTGVDRDGWPKVQAESRFNDPPKAGERMLLISLRVKNISTNQRPENIDSYAFSLVGSRNRLYDQFDDDTDCGVISKELDANLFPNGQAEGNVCFKVPTDETGFLLVWQEFFSDELTYFALE